MGVGDERQRHGEDGQPRAPALDEGHDEGRRHDRREQGDEGVHPRLLRVVGQERVDRGQQRRDPGRAVAEERAPPQPGGRDGEDREGDGERVRVGLAAAEDAHPQLEDQVVQRRRAVLAQDGGDVAQRMRRDADRQALVDPEAGVDGLGAQREREPDEEGQDEQRLGQADGQARGAQPGEPRPRARDGRRRGAHPQCPTIRQPPEIANVRTPASPPRLSMPGTAERLPAVVFERSTTPGVCGGQVAGHAGRAARAVVCSPSSQATDGHLERAGVGRAAAFRRAGPPARAMAPGRPSVRRAW